MFNNIVETIGNTPLVKLNKVDQNSADIYVKLEASNPSGSVKDRAVLYIINDLVDKGELKAGGTIVESTSGNTGVGLAMLGAALDFNVVLVMPDSMSVERRKLFSAYGAELVLTPGAEGMAGAGKKAEEIAEQRNAPILGQFQSPANTRAHEKTTAQEILKDVPDLDAFVAGVGTGGTVSGVGNVLKDKDEQTTVWAVEPKDSPVLSGGQAGSHKIQGLGANFVPDIYNSAVVDHVYTVSNEDSKNTTVQLAKDEGILTGISGGANLFATFELAKQLGKGKKVVTVLPDTGERYLSSGIFDVNDDEEA